MSPEEHPRLNGTFTTHFFRRLCIGLMKSAAGPDAFAFFTAQQITSLAIGPVQAQTIVIGSESQCERAQWPGRGLFVRLIEGTSCFLDAVLQLIQAHFQALDRSICRPDTCLLGLISVFP